MKKLIVLAVGLSCLAAGPARLTNKELVRKATLSLVHIQHENAICAGFVVDSSKGQALTAEHCLPQNGEQLFADGVPSDVIKKNDLFALVTIPRMARPPLELASSIDVGDDVVAVGFGHGILSAVHRMVAAKAAGDLILDGTMYPGMSGGPVLDQFGSVVGLNQMSNPSEGNSAACGIEEIKSFLKSKK